MMSPAFSFDGKPIIISLRQPRPLAKPSLSGKDVATN